MRPFVDIGTCDAAITAVHIIITIWSGPIWKTLNRQRIAKQVYGFDNGKGRLAHTHTHIKKINCILFVTVRFQVLSFFWHTQKYVCIREREREKVGKHFYGYVNTEENCLHSFLNISHSIFFIYFLFLSFQLISFCLEGSRLNCKFLFHSFIHLFIR